MGKYRLFILAGIMVMIVLLSGCGNEVPGESQESTSVSSPLPSVSVEDEEPEEAEFAVSGDMAVFRNSVIFVDKTDMLLKSLNIETGDLRILFDIPVYDEFILDGTKVVFTNADNGMLVYGDILKGRTSELAVMPMGKGAKIGDLLFFVDTKSFGKDYALYKYDIASGMWENRRLAGNPCSPNRETVCFGADGIWYVSHGEDGAKVCSMAYSGFEEKTVYSSLDPKGIKELIVSDGDLFFVDSSHVAYVVPSGTETAVQYLENVTRIYSCFSEGIFYQKSSGYPVKLYIGNENGNSLDVFGGVIVSSYGTRSLIRRFADGKEQLVMVKYPEDSVVYSRECSLFDTVTNGRYVIAFINDSQYLYFFDLETGEEKYFQKKRLDHRGVSLEEYFAGEGLLVAPSEGALRSASDAEIAELFIEAVRRNDRYTMYMLLSEGDSLTPYLSFNFESCVITELDRTETRVKYGLDFTYHTAADDGLKNYMPDCLKNGCIVLVRENDLWKVDTNAS